MIILYYENKTDFIKCHQNFIFFVKFLVCEFMKQRIEQLAWIIQDYNISVSQGIITKMWED